MKRISEIRRAQELLSGALRSLTGTGPQQERLLRALVYSLGNLDSPPPEIADKFVPLMARFEDRESYDAVVAGMDKSEVHAIVEDILGMAGTVDRLWHTV
jgi:hypothetical protein